ncbi:serine/threonine protein kinase [Polytolypa hystricis UAMH7299]|uniref:Serine/threonine protein kinase n=1 Tax=Polytolypa hystricis (strain UAMH7299) TaxID=1447883 RepID=A0A2B7Z2B2_POLH7|nr:serine/threonine protein kinase [Polytolypa hystricis UAMH7299]
MGTNTGMLESFDLLSDGQSSSVRIVDEVTVAKFPLSTAGDARHDREHAVECRIYERLGQHPRIVRLIFIGHGYIVLERLGCGLRERLRLLHEAAEGLQYLHSRIVLQVDIGAHNLLLDSDNNIKFCDFAGSSIDGEPALVRPSAHFKFPFADSKMNIPTIVTELFALGSLIYEISTAQRPYEGKPDTEIKSLYRALRFPEIGHLLLGPMVMKCWLSQYPHVGAVVADIEKIKANMMPQGQGCKSAYGQQPSSKEPGCIRLTPAAPENLGLGRYKQRLYRLAPNTGLNPASVGTVSLVAGGIHAAAITHDNKTSIREGDSDADSDGPGLNLRDATPTAIPASSFSPATKFVLVAAGDTSTFVWTEDGLGGVPKEPRNRNTKDPAAHPKSTKHYPDINSATAHLYETVRFRSYLRQWHCQGKGSPLSMPLLSMPWRRLRVRFLTQKVPSLRKNRIKHILRSIHYSAAITCDGECLAWGRIDDGWIGLDIKQFLLAGSRIIVERNRPRILLGPTVPPLIANCIYVAAGGHHNIAVTADGKAYS